MRLDKEKPGKELQALGADTAEGAWAGTNPNSLWRCKQWGEHGLGSLHSSNRVGFGHMCQGSSPKAGTWGRTELHSLAVGCTALGAALSRGDLSTTKTEQSLFSDGICHPVRSLRSPALPAVAVSEAKMQL